MPPTTTNKMEEFNYERYSKVFQQQKGKGFITGEIGMDYFFHYSQIRMDGHKALADGGIVYFEISELDKNNRVQALNVEPVLTLAMVTHKLAKEGLHPMCIRDYKGIHGWYVADESENPVEDKKMSLMELAAYAGFSISEE